MRKITVKAISLLNRNTGFLILAAIIFFGLAIIGIQKDNNSLLANQSETNEQLRLVLCTDVPEEQCNLAKAVNDLKLDNAQQTIILCKLILGGNLNVSESDADEIERICNERVNLNNERQDSNTASPAPSQSTPQPQPPAPQNQSPAPSPTPEQPEQEEETEQGNGLSDRVERILDRVRELF